MTAHSVFAWNDLIWFKFELHPALPSSHYQLIGALGDEEAAKRDPRLRKASVRSVVVMRTLVECGWWSYYNPRNNITSAGLAP